MLYEHPDSFHGSKQGIASEQFKDRGSYLVVGRCVIEDHDPHVPELQRGIVEVANRAQPRLLRAGFRLREHSRAYGVEHIDDIVPGGCFECVDEGEQRRGTPLLWKPRYRLRSCGRGEFPKRSNLARRNAVDLWKFLNERVYLSETEQRTADLRPALDERSIAEPVKRALTLPFSNRNKGIKPQTGFCVYPSARRRCK